MFTKSIVALAIIVGIVGITSSAGAAPQEKGATSDHQVLINRCANWDAYGRRCDSGSW
jgi:hypothetical protein